MFDVGLRSVAVRLMLMDGDSCRQDIVVAAVASSLSLARSKEFGLIDIPKHYN